MANWRFGQFSGNNGDYSAAKLDNWLRAHVCSTASTIDAQVVKNSPPDNFIGGNRLSGSESSACLIRKQKEYLPLLFRLDVVEQKSEIGNASYLSPLRHGVSQPRSTCVFGRIGCVYEVLEKYAERDIVRPKLLAPTFDELGGGQDDLPQAERAGL
jgi:hypothetical protein